MKKIIIVISILAYLLLSIISISAASSVSKLEADTIVELWYDFLNCSIFYDVNQHQYVYPQVSFASDSKGQLYAGGKQYTYMILGDKDLGDIYDKTLDAYKKVMTADLADRMAEDFHVSGGPDVEIVRQGADGTWYKLALILPSLLNKDSIKSISVTQNQAKVQIAQRSMFIFESGYEPQEYNDYQIYTIELECIDGEWKFSGGSVFDYLRNYAETSPYTGDESDTAVITLAMGAVVSALIPTTVFIRRRKRKLEV